MFVISPTEPEAELIELNASLLFFEAKYFFCISINMFLKLNIIVAQNFVFKS